MASRRLLKKDIDNLINELITDCYICIYEHSDKDLSGFELIINEAIVLRDDLLSRINHADKNGDKTSAFYRELRKDLTLGLANSYQKLNGLIE